MPSMTLWPRTRLVWLTLPNSVGPGASSGVALCW
jgi:hypothetical protein